ncbi:nucleosome assembly protein (NAP) domain-containing protein [Phthorimaea operculella]|nr:nucleosome assembly protein (NAP) domain-containing protein [Phthorimaea operculella]
MTPPLLASLPPNVRKRVRGLRSLQKEFVDIEAKFYSEVHALECKYEKLYKPLFEKKLTAPSSEVRVSITPPLLASLPPVVRKRVRGLRSLQKEFVDIEAKFYSEVHALECKYEKLYKPLFEKRSLQKEFVDIEAKFYSEVHALECKYEKLYKPLFEKKLTAPSSEVRVSITPPLLASLPPVVGKRVRGLRSLQKEFVDIEAKFYSEVTALECKYEKLYKPLFEKRAQIVNGEYEPTDEECQNPWRDEEEEELAKAVANAAITDGDKKDEDKPAEPPMDPNVKGIPDFWFTIFRNVSMLAEMMQEHDEPILKTLQDIKVHMHEDPIGFTLEFHFAPNDYFENKVLTKEYSMKCKPDEDNPLEFEGPEIYSCKGCEINWKKGKNVTVKTVKKKQKHKSRGSVRTVTKSVQADSFFNFFSPPAMPDDPNSTLASDIQALLTADFEIGHYIRERVVSRATSSTSDRDRKYRKLLIKYKDDVIESQEDSYSDEDSGTEEVSDPED